MSSYFLTYEVEPRTFQNEGYTMEPNYPPEPQSSNVPPHPPGGVGTIAVDGENVNVLMYQTLYIDNGGGKFIFISLLIVKKARKETKKLERK